MSKRPQDINPTLETQITTQPECLQHLQLYIDGSVKKWSPKQLSENMDKGLE